MCTPHLAVRDTRKAEIYSVFVGFYIEVGVFSFDLRRRYFSADLRAATAVSEKPCRFLKTSF